MRRAALLACAAVLAHATPAALAATAPAGPRLDPQNLIADDIESEALAAYRQAAAHKPFRGQEIVIVDYRLPSTARRLFILNLATGAAEAHYVAHGRGSDPGHSQRAQRFSDVPSTGMSSVGAYRGLERYRSAAHGPALRLAGLSTTNANAFDRLIVLHTADYFAPAEGRFGRSCGCFVVTTSDMTRVYDVIADGGFLYAGPARLNDQTASFQRDCNPACGNACPEPLIAQMQPKAQPSPKAEPAPATELAFAPPLPLSKPASVTLDPVAEAYAFNPPLPIAKPDLAPSSNPIALLVPDVAVGEIPTPAPKPAGLQQVADARPLP